MKKSFIASSLVLYACLVTAQNPHPMGSMHGMHVAADSMTNRDASWLPERPTDPSRPGTVVYHLTISDTMVRYTGKERMAIAINGSIPGPALHFTEGDTAVIYIHNHMRMATSLHWHGLIVPNEYDGVPNLTTPPVAP